MASTDPEIKDGFPIPVWMKTKSTTRDFEAFAASPPAPEDSFFIRYPKADALFGGQGSAQQELMAPEQGRLQPSLVGVHDWSKHTKPCQDVMHGIANVNNPVNSLSGAAKSAGADDGVKGEGAACGTSVVKVAHQMVSTRSASQRGFTIASIDEHPESPIMSPPQYHGTRRGSKSLPVSPAHTPPSSPNSRRRRNGNKYFASPFEPVDDGSGRSWLTMALLGFKKDLATSTSTLAEEDILEARLHGSSFAESVESLGPAPKGRDMKMMSGVDAPTQQPKLTKPVHNFLPKPSELREMNFWSPTSM